MLQTLGGYRARLSCADGQKRYTLRSAGKDRDCPFSIRRQATSAAFTQTNGRRPVKFADGYGVVDTCSLAGVFKQNPLVIARNIFGDVPVVPGEVLDALAAVLRGRHGRPLVVQTYQYAAVGGDILQPESTRHP